MIKSLRYFDGKLQYMDEYQSEWIDVKEVSHDTITQAKINTLAWVVSMINDLQSRPHDEGHIIEYINLKINELKSHSSKTL